MSLVEELRQKEPRELGRAGLQAFLFHKDEIRKALDDGFNLKTIWKHLSDNNTMPIGYRQFTTYVSRYLKADSESKKETKTLNDSVKQKQIHATDRQTFKMPAQPLSKDELY